MLHGDRQVTVSGRIHGIPNTVFIVEYAGMAQTIGIFYSLLCEDVLEVLIMTARIGAIYSVSRSSFSYSQFSTTTVTKHKH